MDDNRVKSTNSDEIDLSQLFRWIGNGFRNFGQGVLNSVAGLRKTFFDHKLFFGLIILAGLVIGGYYSEGLSKKYYRSSMILSCDYLNNRIATNLVEKLNALAGEPQRTGLANELTIDIATAKNILGFSVKPFVSEKDLVEMEVLKEQLNNVAESKKDLVAKVIKKIEVENKNAFLIEVLVYDPNVIKDLEASLVNYFKNTSYLKNRIQAARLGLLDRQTKLKRDLNKIDSLKNALYENFTALAKKSGQGSTNVILNDKELNTQTEIFYQGLAIHRELLEVEFNLSVKPEFEVVDGLTSFNKPDSASLPKVLVISFFASWILGYVILGLFKFDRYLASLSKANE